MEEFSALDDFGVQAVNSKIEAYSRAIIDIENNLNQPDFYEGDRETVQDSKERFERDLRALRIQQELAICAGIPAVRA